MFSSAQNLISTIMLSSYATGLNLYLETSPFFMFQYRTSHVPGFAAKGFFMDARVEHVEC